MNATINLTTEEARALETIARYESYGDPCTYGHEDDPVTQSLFSKGLIALESPTVYASLNLSQCFYVLTDAGFAHYADENTSPQPILSDTEWCAATPFPYFVGAFHYNALTNNDNLAAIEVQEHYRRAHRAPAPVKSRKLYAQAPNGEVFVRSSDNGYMFAVIHTYEDGKLANIVSWHRRVDLARKAAGQGKDRSVVTVSREAPAGSCGNCHGTGQVRCSKCHGNPEKDMYMERRVKDANGNAVKDETGRWDVYEKVSTHHFSCTCKTGKRKCHVCGGKGVIKAVSRA